MCMGGGNAPAVQKAPTPPAIVAPIEANSSSAKAGDLERKRRQAASGRSDTILTSGIGAADAPVAGGKKLLGE